MNIHYKSIVSLLQDAYGFRVDTWRKEATLNLEDRTVLVFLPYDGPCEVYVYQLGKATVTRCFHNAQVLDDFLKCYIPLTTPSA